MTTELVIVGVGGQGRECLDIAEAMIDRGADLKVRGFVDDAPAHADRERLESRGQEFLGGFEALLEEHRDASACLGIGSGGVRRRLDGRLVAAGLDAATLIHPDSSIGSNVELSPGCVIFAGARLTTSIRLGRHVHVNQNATIGHDSSLGGYVTVNPLAAVSGNVTIGDAATVGAGAVILQGLTIGDGATVGASACVTRKVAPAMTVKGVPAR